MKKILIAFAFAFASSILPLDAFAQQAPSSIFVGPAKYNNNGVIRFVVELPNQLSVAK